jgi:hypothetical protein
MIISATVERTRTLERFQSFGLARFCLIRTVRLFCPMLDFLSRNINTSLALAYLDVAVFGALALTF